MKTFVLCRHAKSDWPAGVADENRPLKGRGVKDANRLGNWLSEHGFKPDLILSSPANRAHSTAKIIAAHLGYAEGNILVDSALYFQGTAAMIRTIQEVEDKYKTIMLFGHNPTMESAVSHLLQMGSYYQMPTSGMVCMESYVNQWKNLDASNISMRWALVPRMKRKEV